MQMSLDVSVIVTIAGDGWTSPGAIGAFGSSNQFNLFVLLGPNWFSFVRMAMQVHLGQMVSFGSVCLQSGLFSLSSK